MKMTLVLIPRTDEDTLTMYYVQMCDLSELFPVFMIFFNNVLIFKKWFWKKSINYQREKKIVLNVLLCIFGDLQSLLTSWIANIWQVPGLE